MAELVKEPRGNTLRAAPEGSGTQEFLSFMLAGELYALRLSRIREIVNPPPLTRVPRAPRHTMGICSVRGLLVTVLDLRRRLGLTAIESTRLSRILLAKADSDEVFGLYVDEVRQVVRLQESEIELTSEVLGGELSDNVLGIGRPDGEMLILLDLQAIVTG